MRGALYLAILVALNSISVAIAAEPGPVTLGAGELATVGRRSEPPPPPALPPRLDAAIVERPAPPEAPTPAVARLAPAPLAIAPPRLRPMAVVERPASVPGPTELGSVSPRGRPDPPPVAAPVKVAAAVPPAIARPAPRPVVTAIVLPVSGPVLLDAAGLQLIGP